MNKEYQEFLHSLPLDELVELLAISDMQSVRRKFPFTSKTLGITFDIDTEKYNLAKEEQKRRGFHWPDALGKGLDTSSWSVRTVMGVRPPAPTLEDLMGAIPCNPKLKLNLVKPRESGDYQINYELPKVLEFDSFDKFFEALIDRDAVEDKTMGILRDNARASTPDISTGTGWVPSLYDSGYLRRPRLPHPIPILGLGAPELINSFSQFRMSQREHEKHPRCTSFEHFVKALPDDELFELGEMVVGYSQHRGSPLYYRSKHLDSEEAVYGSDLPFIYEQIKYRFEVLKAITAKGPSG